MSGIAKEPQRLREKKGGGGGTEPENCLACLVISLPPGFCNSFTWSYSPFLPLAPDACTRAQITPDHSGRLAFSVFATRFGS